ncbi:MAG: DUF1232 domain-containing protein [Deltaproteobacteria bacterium]|nr:DUF1232 domain-containing protein [Deltaproteobacteria bacterium]
MSDINNRCLDVFPQWLDTVGSDVAILRDVLLNSEAEENVKRKVAGGINYLFKSLDLIPDGIDDIGYLDDAFVLRMSAVSAVSAGIDSLPDNLKERLHQLAADTSLIKELLEDTLFAKFEKYCNSLSDGSARGRTVDEIITDENVRKELLDDITAFVNEYKSLGFNKDEKNLIKLKAFMEAKLPA